MAQRTWFITGVSSGFGRELAEQILQRGDRLVGTVRSTSKVAFPGNSMYHATKWGIESFAEAVAQEVAPMPVYDGSPAHGFLRMLDPKNGLAPGDPARMARRIIESVEVTPAPLRMVLESVALESALTTLRTRVKGFEAQAELAASTDFPPGE
jgi:NAD(P)-dependent dehydrogenase (short-subunit alcohol dehydrogenase family)